MVTTPSTDLPADLFDGIDAVLFDLDGVLTPTAVVHMHAWSRLFTPFLAAHGARPYADEDYFDHIDGKPRYEGVRALLASRDLELPDGDPADGPDAPTVCGLGNRKNQVFNEVLEAEGVEPYPGSVRLVDAVIATGRKVAVVSSSKNAPAVLAAAGIDDRFGIVVDGLVAAELGLPGKPHPATFRYAAAQLGVDADRAAVVEDAPSGVAAGRDGEFALVLGVDRGAGAQVLLDQGATLVVADLEEFVPLVDGTSPASAEEAR